MNTIYSFSFSTDKSEQEHSRTISATSYKNAIEKACIILEDVNIDLDLLELESWEEVQDECDKYGIYVSDLIEDYE